MEKKKLEGGGRETMTIWYEIRYIRLEIKSKYRAMLSMYI
jgi:hypothetical protein